MKRVVHKKSWFIRRIGKRIYRLTKNGCACDTCTLVFKEGLVIGSKTHASYLHDVQCDLQARYADSKEAKK